jgi:pilus assembly protein Flp/PilA
MATRFKKFIAARSGATAVEYAFLAMLIALVIIASLTTIGSKLQNSFNEVSANLK